MSGLIDDAAELRVVIEQLIGSTAIHQLLGPLHPDDRSVEDLMVLNGDEEAEVTLIDSEDEPVALLFVDLVGDPLDDWDVRLRGWRLLPGTASV